MNEPTVKRHTPESAEADAKRDPNGATRRAAMDKALQDLMREAGMKRGDGPGDYFALFLHDGNTEAITSLNGDDDVLRLLGWAYTQIKRAKDATAEAAAASAAGDKQH